MKKNYFLAILFAFSFFGAKAQPSAAAPNPPARNTADVISLFSGAYTDISGTDWFPNWGQSTVVADTTIVGNVAKKYSNINYQGVQFAPAVNASSMTSLHIDLWTANCNSFDVFLINTSPTTVEQKVTLTPTLNGWNSYDIALSQYTTIALNNIGQFKFVGTTGSTVYLDNIYFWKSANTPTISGFSVPAQLVGNAPFTLTAPTSNSTGAFTYTSSNTAVATISGSTVTVVGAGTSIITANQAAAGSFGTGSTTASLVVTFPPPATAAPIPTNLAANVISLFSGAYTDVAGTDWFPNWGQSTVVSDVSIAGNTTKKYDNLNYQGVQFASAINASTMTNLHLDIWTPNCASLDVFLINTTPGVVEQKVTLTPTLSGWNSFNIALSQYSTIALNNIGQFKFVGTTGSTVYLDNIYFWKPANAPTLSNFSVPAKLVGDAAFTLTAPTSNSTGAFTYVSGNTSVATISGNTVTIVGAGTSIITANQAAAGAFGPGSITAPLVVSFPPPPTAAPNPTTPSTNVLSLFSNVYTNVASIDWFPNWGQSTVVTDISIGGNTTKRYENLNYQGVQFATAINAANANTLHLDLWTPNCTSFTVSLINTSPTTVEQAFVITPTLSGWNSINIPLSAFGNIALNNIGQFKFEGTTGSTVYLDNVYFFGTVALPAAISNFNGVKATNNSSALSWKTLSEVNNKGFYVERSGNGTNWTNITFIPSQGNSNTEVAYTAYDKNPLKGINQYRLKQMDNDGKTTFSKIVTLNYGNTVGFTISPNPAKEVVNVFVEATTSNKANIEIINAEGKIVRNVNVPSNSINSNIAININGLSKGTYYIALKDGATVKTAPLVIN